MTIVFRTVAVAILCSVAPSAVRGIQAQQPDTTAAAVVDTLRSRILSYRAAQDTTNLVRLFRGIAGAQVALAASFRDSVVRLERQRDLYSEVLVYSERFLNKLIIGTASTFTGAGIARLDITFATETSPWRDERIRNSFDKGEPYLKTLGAGLLAAGVFLKPSADQGSRRTLAISGGSILALAFLGKQILGANEDKVLQSSAKQIDQVNASIQQLTLSRKAYDELTIRREIANDYYMRAQTLLDTLKARQAALQDVYTQFAKVKGEPTSISANVVAVIDDISSDFAIYETVVGFVDAYTTQLQRTYVTYARSYPLLKERLEIASADIASFRTAYDNKIRLAFLADLPRLRLTLADFRFAIKNSSDEHDPN